jgi:predicted RNA binding protein YcfA (HicA-like mRNA interferase family)
MPKFAQIYGMDLIRILEKHGFKEHSRSGSHYTLKNSSNGKRTTIPVHNKPIGKGLLGAIFRQT